LELGHLIDGIDVINALDAIQIPLVNRIQAQVAGPALRVGLAPDGDGRACRPGGVELAALPLIAVGLAQVIRMGHRDMGQCLIAVIAMNAEHALAQLLRRRPTRGPVQRIEFSQETGIGIAVVAAKPATVRCRRRTWPWSTYCATRRVTVCRE
jgi:hypothetical protein